MTNFFSKSKKSLTYSLLFFALAVNWISLPHQAQAQVMDWSQRGAAQGIECVAPGTSVATIQGIMCLLANIMSVTLSLIGLAGFVMLVYGSIQWLLSGGNSQAVDSSKKTITFAFVGLVLALASFLIMNIIARFTGVSLIEQFIIPPSNTGMEGGPDWDTWDSI